MDLLNVDTELVAKVTSAMVAMRVVAPPPREIRVEVPVPQAAGAGAGAGAGARVQEKPPQQRDTPPPKRKVVVDEPPKEPVHVPRVPGVGELEVAEDLVNRGEELEDARKKMEVRRNMMGKEVDEINKQLRDKALDPRTRKALQHRRERRVAAIEDMDERMKALLAERERNLLLVMNAYARVHKIAKVKGECNRHNISVVSVFGWLTPRVPVSWQTIFKGHIYRHIVSSMGGVSEHLHMKTSMQYVFCVRAYVCTHSCC